MKNKIVAKFPATEIEDFACTPIYVADFTERTGSVRGVEISSVMLKCPKKPDNDMDVMQIHNKTELNIVFATFDDNSFKKEGGTKDESHTEGAFFVGDSDDSFFALYEIKDCKPKNMARYKAEIKSKVINSASVMRINEIVSAQKMILAFASFPQHKFKYNNYFNNDLIEMKRMAKEERINFFCSNNFEISSPSNCVPIYE